jgi:hypothetical protein
VGKFLDSLNLKATTPTHPNSYTVNTKAKARVPANLPNCPPFNVTTSIIAQNASVNKPINNRLETTPIIVLISYTQSLPIEINFDMRPVQGFHLTPSHGGQFPPIGLDSPQAVRYMPFIRPRWHAHKVSLPPRISGRNTD